MSIASKPRWMHVLGILVALAIASFPADGLAKKSKAQKLYKKGVTLAKNGQYDEAIRLFEEARARGAPPVTLFNIGKCYEALGLFYVAAEYYGEYLTYPAAKKVEKIQKRIEELRIKPSVVTFVSVPEGAEVHEELADGTTKKLGVTPIEVSVEAGRHKYIVMKEGYEDRIFDLETGYGKPYPLEVSLATGVVTKSELDPDEIIKGKKKKKKKGSAAPYDPVGFVLEIGGGASVHLLGSASYATASGGTGHVGVIAGGDASFGLGYRFGHGASTGFALGLRADFRPLSLSGRDGASGDRGSHTGMFAGVLAVPAVQVGLHRVVGLEFSLPLGLAWLVPPKGMDEDFRVDLVDGYIEGGSLILFDLGAGISLRFAVAAGFFIAIEPIRAHLLFPLKKWKADMKVLPALDFTVRLGYEF